MYVGLKALHVAAMVAWMGGLLVVPAIVARAPDGEALAAARRHYARVTTPAMVATLALGIWMAADAGWFRAGWLQAKLALVLALAGLHGVVSGTMRRIARTAQPAAPWWFRTAPALVVVAVTAIALLAVVKPAFR